MLSSGEYYILAFQTTTDAMAAEKYAKERFSVAVMPVPREISSGCGLAIRFLEPEEECILEFCRDFPVRGTLYKMGTVKVEGKHPVQKLLELN